MERLRAYKPRRIEVVVARVVIFKEKKTWSWIGRPERFANHQADESKATRYLLF